MTLFQTTRSIAMLRYYYTTNVNTNTKRRKMISTKYATAITEQNML